MPWWVFIQTRRGELVAAALTLMRGYISARAQRVESPLGSFEVSDGLVRQTVVWLSTLQQEFALADPNTSTHSTSAADDGRDQLAATLSAWRGAFGSEVVTAANAIEFSQGGDLDGGTAAATALRSAIAALARHPKESIDARRLGIWLRSHRDQLANGCRFEAITNRTGTMEWFANGVSAGTAGTAGSVLPPP